MLLRFGGWYGWMSPERWLTSDQRGTVAAVLLRVPIGDDPSEFVEVEVDRRDLGDTVELTSGGRDFAVAAFSLGSSFDQVLPALSTILTKLRSVAHSPDKVEMTLGLKVGGETGLIFAKGSAEATFTVALTWRKPGSSND
jgi:hypothetical protein